MTTPQWTHLHVHVDENQRQRANMGHDAYAVREARLWADTCKAPLAVHVDFVEWTQGVAKVVQTRFIGLVRLSSGRLSATVNGVPVDDSDAPG